MKLRDILNEIHESGTRPNPQEVTTSVKDLTFSMIKGIFHKNYKEEHFKRPTNGEMAYQDAVSFPTTDGRTKITDPQVLDTWKEKTLQTQGNIKVILNPLALTWFNKVKIQK